MLVRAVARSALTDGCYLWNTPAADSACHASCVPRIRLGNYEITHPPRTWRDRWRGGRGEREVKLTICAAFIHNSSLLVMLGPRHVLKSRSQPNITQPGRFR